MREVKGDETPYFESKKMISGARGARGEVSTYVAQRGSTLNQEMLLTASQLYSPLIPELTHLRDLLHTLLVYKKRHFGV